MSHCGLTGCVADFVVLFVFCTRRYLTEESSQVLSLMVYIQICAEHEQQRQRGETPYMSTVQSLLCRTLDD